MYPRVPLHTVWAINRYTGDILAPSTPGFPVLDPMRLLMRLSWDYHETIMREIEEKITFSPICPDFLGRILRVLLDNLARVRVLVGR